MSDIDYPSLCTVEGCDRPHLARGWCKLHYYRWRRRGDLSNPEVHRGDCLKWIRAHINHEGEGCLTWPYARLKNGRGVVLFQGRMQLTGRVMCILAHGDPPQAKMEAAHRCGMGHEGCVHPGHLYWATPSQNRNDRKDHGTEPRGESAPWSKLTESDVRTIRRMAATHRHADIAAQFSVSRSMVGKIVARQAWSHVGGDDV